MRATRLIGLPTPTLKASSRPVIIQLPSDYRKAGIQLSKLPSTVLSSLAISNRLNESKRSNHFATDKASAKPKNPTSARSMFSYVEIIGSESYDCSSTVQLIFNDGRYLFECGNGTQRLCCEYGMKLSKVKGVYLSSVTPPSIGGLPGLLMTIADIDKENMAIAAPKGVAELFQIA